MKADQIRCDSKNGYGDPVGSPEQAAIYFLAEIAAQLAELNDRLGNWQGKLPVAIDASISPGSTRNHYDVRTR